MSEGQRAKGEARKGRPQRSAFSFRKFAQESVASWLSRLGKMEPETKLRWSYEVARRVCEAKLPSKGFAPKLLRLVSRKDEQCHCCKHYVPTERSIPIRLSGI